MSRRTFLRTFREITGHTTNEILTARRINASIHHINFTEKSLSEIAQEVGLYDKSRLSKLFYEYYGVTPTEYKQINHSAANRANFLHEMRWDWLGTDTLSENDFNKN